MVVYTVGYSGFEVENFIAVLKSYGVSCLVDVRSVPISAYFVSYNKFNLAKLLKSSRIIYRHYDKEFGARQDDKCFYTNDIMDFSKFSQSKQFMEGVSKIEKGMNLGYTFAFMCAEKRPEICHRCILVARKFFELNYEVRHILADGNYITHKEVEKLLLKSYFPDHNEVSLFGSMSEEEMIKKSYEKRNLEIGYRWEDVLNAKAVHDRFYQKNCGTVFQSA